MMDKKMRVGIFLGGPSSEREVSLESGRHYHANLNPDKYETIPIYMDFKKRLWEIPLPLLVQNTTADIEARLNEAKAVRFEDLPKIIDFALLGLHGKFVEDGCIQGLFELLNIPYSGSGVLGSAVGMNKYVQRQLLQAEGLNVPSTVPVKKSTWEKGKEEVKRSLLEAFSFPFIVKPISEGCSTGVAKIKSEEDLDKALEETFKWDTTALVEEFLDGMEFTTTVIGVDEPRALTPTEVPAGDGHDYLTLEDKFLPGGAQMITPARTSAENLEKIREVMVKAYKTLDAKVYSRIDGFLVGDKVYILEINTLPGATPSTCLYQQAAHEGWTPMDFVDQIIEMSLKAHREKKGPL